MCEDEIFNITFLFATVCNLYCNSHGNATSDCLACACEPNWGDTTCDGMYVCIKKEKIIFLLSFRHNMFTVSSFMNEVKVIYIWRYVRT